MTILIMPQILERCPICHNIICGWQMSYSQILGFLANLDEVRHLRSWRGHMRSFWEISPFSWMEQATCAPSFFLNPSNQVVHKHHVVLRRKPHPYWASYYVKISAPKFGSHIWATHGQTSDNKHCQPNKKSCMLWSMRISYVIWSTW